MNPYEVLGVNPNDDEETIKKAYRSLVKKYHPDRYVNTPMADMATEKLKEINEAYDMITNKKTSSSSGRSYGGERNYGGGYASGFDGVRMLIRMRRLAEAEAMLSGLEKNAEWYYLMGLIYINRGWYDKGRGFVETAVRMDPSNAEYRATLSSFETQGRAYREFKTEYINCCGASDLMTCLCGSLLCSRCCCC